SSPPHPSAPASTVSSKPHAHAAPHVPTKRENTLCTHVRLSPRLHWPRLSLARAPLSAAGLARTPHPLSKCRAGTSTRGRASCGVRVTGGPPQPTRAMTALRGPLACNSPLDAPLSSRTVGALSRTDPTRPRCKHLTR